MTQVEFAQLFGVHSFTVSRWERDVVRITEPMAKLIRLLSSARARASRKRTRKR